MGTTVHVHRGVAVHLAARIAALAGPGQVLLSSTVWDLDTGTGVSFKDLDEHELKGIAETWKIFALEF